MQFITLTPHTVLTPPHSFSNPADPVHTYLLSQIVSAATALPSKVPRVLILCARQLRIHWAWEKCGKHIPLYMPFTMKSLLIL